MVWYGNSFSDVVSAKGRPMRATIIYIKLHGKPLARKKTMSFEILSNCRKERMTILIRTS